VEQASKSDSLLSGKVAKSGLWIFALRVSDGSFGLIKLLILARLLAPSDFGLLGVAFLIIATLDTFSQTGLDTALIQMKDDIKEYLNTVWSISIIKGLILYAILFISAPYVAVFFNSPESVLIIRVVGITIILRSFTNIGTIYFQKELEFNKLFLCRFSSTIANFIVSIIAAFMLKSVWALVFGQLADCITGVVASYLFRPHRPRFVLDLVKVRRLFGFGKWVFISSILVFLFNQGDDYFVGNLLGMTALGFYQMAYKISNMPATEITHMISKVTYPAYSKIQDDLPRLRDAYLRILKLTAFLSFPVAGLIFSLAPDFTIVILGEKWMPMVPSMQVLVLWGLIRSIGATTGPVFYSVGKPDIATKLQTFQLILLMIFLYPFTIKWGILGTSLAVVLASAVVNIVVFFKVTKVIQCSIWSFAKVLIYPIVSILVTSISIMFIKIHFINSKGISEFIIFVLYGILVYSGISYFFDKFFRYQIISTVRDSLSSLFK
jgi:O-antigen/teichoic acid export membrane protein